jgi:hypothetical protein
MVAISSFISLQGSVVYVIKENQMKNTEKRGSSQ